MKKAVAKKPATQKGDKLCPKCKTVMISAASMSGFIMAWQCPKCGTVVEPKKANNGNA